MDNKPEPSVGHGPALTLSDQPTKGDKLITANCMGAMQHCEYEHKVIRQDDCHCVKITTGEYKGVCYKGIAELYQPSKTEPNGNA